MIYELTEAKWIIQIITSNRGSLSNDTSNNEAAQRT